MLVSVILDGWPPYQGITFPVTSKSFELPTTVVAFQVKYPQIALDCCVSSLTAVVVFGRSGRIWPTWNRVRPWCSSDLPCRTAVRGREMLITSSTADENFLVSFWILKIVLKPSLKPKKDVKLCFSGSTPSSPLPP